MFTLNKTYKQSHYDDQCVYYITFSGIEDAKQSREVKGAMYTELMHTIEVLKLEKEDPVPSYIRGMCQYYIVVVLWICFWIQTFSMLSLIGVV